MSKANYTNSNVNTLPEGIHYSKISGKYVVRVSQKINNIVKVVSIGQDKDRSVAEKILQNYLDGKK